MGRALGETMIVLMATGNAALITLDVFSSVRTMTATIAAELGAVSQGGPQYQALFLVGAILFTLTFILEPRRRARDRAHAPEARAVSDRRASTGMMFEWLCRA